MQPFTNNNEGVCGRNTLVFAYSGENKTLLEKHKKLLVAPIHFGMWGYVVMVQNWVIRRQGINFTVYLFKPLTSEPC